MTLQSILQLVGACLGVNGSLFFAVGVLSQSAQLMANLSMTPLGLNRHAIEVLSSQKADYVFGGRLIACAFFAQVVSFLVPNDSFVVHESNAAIVCWSAAALAALVMFPLRYFAGKLAHAYRREIVAEIKKELGPELVGSSLDDME